MGSPKKEVAQASDQLRHMETKHKRLVKRIDKGREKMDKRAKRLREVEAEIARMEKQVVALGHANANGDSSAMPALRHAYLIFNPNSGAEGKEGRSPQPLVEALRAHGIQAEVGFKSSGKVARRLARQAVKDKHSLVIVAGGDGTIEDVASQLVGTDAILGILPTGTRNNLARELGVPLDINEACDLLAAGI